MLAPEFGYLQFCQAAAILYFVDIYYFVSFLYIGLLP